MVIKLGNDLFLVQSFEHHKPGKGAAVVRVKLKNLVKSNTTEKTFRSGEMLEDVEIDKRNVIYSYREGDSIVFMDSENYDQISIPNEDIGDVLPFLKEGTELQILLYEGNPITILPPNFIDLKVKYAEEGLRGDTATNATKEVRLETGSTLQVPLFVKTGDVVRVDLRDFKYSERI